MKTDGDGPVERRAFRADRGDGGGRLDHAIRRHLADHPGASRARIRHWIASGRVSVNGRVAAKPASRVSPGDRIEVDSDPPPARIVHEAEKLPLDIVFEDEHLLALNKPAGLIVHPSYGHRAGTLMNALLWRQRTSDTWTDMPRLLHRLDKHTSGLLLVSKNLHVHASLTRAMRAQHVDKDYLAIVHGRVPNDTGAIALKLGRDPLDRRRVVVSGTAARDSLTRFERLATSQGSRRGLSLLRCRLVTGRMHQIRAHLLAAGWPIVGDPIYGATGRRAIADAALARLVEAFPRQALHAWRLALTHPVTGQSLALTARPPDDFLALLSAAGLPLTR